MSHDSGFRQGSHHVASQGPKRSLRRTSTTRYEELRTKRFHEHERSITETQPKDEKDH
jgi:hypothetical protein